MQKETKYYLSIAAAVLLLATAAWFLKNIFTYILVAGILAMFGEPLMKVFGRITLGRKKIPRSISALLALLSLLLVFLAFLALFIPLVVEEARIISSVKEEDVLNSFREPLNAVENFFGRFEVDYGEGKTFETYIQGKLASFLSFAQLSSIVNSLVGITGDFFVAVFAISFLTFFFLRDKAMIHQNILLLVPPKHIGAIREILSDTKRLLTRYFIGIGIQMVLVASLISTGLFIIGVENALIIGVLAGVANIIPYIGPFIGGSFAIVIGISSNLSDDFYSGILPLIGKICIVFVIVSVIDALFFQPYIYSSTVKAHPLEIFLVILIAGTLTGIGGMILAIPAYTVLRLIAREFLYNFQIVRKMTKDLDD
jgi:predicted PurR-regulated permease PerM